ncbi:MAG TPA: hypothetical protein VIM24_08555, partial [Candidatus Limnocylindrales bacterium]
MRKQGRPDRATPTSWPHGSARERPAAIALDQRAAGDIDMWVPTSSVLERLVETGATNAAELGERLAVGPTPPPRIIEEG